MITYHLKICHTFRARRLFYSLRYVSKSASADGASQNYCMNLVKRYDKENFLCTLLLKNPERRFALAIRALNVEIARISDTVSDDKIGQMRLKFWEDTLDKLYKNDSQAIPEQPVVQEVKQVIDSQKLSKRYFQRLISSRRNANLRFVTTKELEEYAENTVSSVMYLLLEAHGVKNVHADHAASHLGKAQGIVNLLRSIPRQERRSAVPVPQEVLMQHGVSQEHVLRNRKDDKGVEEVIFQLAGLANQHLEKARNLWGSVPKRAKPVFLPGVATGRFLERLRRVNFHLTDPNLLRTDAMLPLAIYWSYFRRNF
ncbi:NADH dehydrogenase (ubiquinone) complex I, assembly factor 6 homolog [Toxorhynchites rutilus septentrionalis]|uniref:NADH dehydrogenase (ubiquinone) complex I, assembly factor 6 homolog n=1 Tax=Toxorhynchites rutilus septentrionalis TaxID=329112 RepID=UPI002479699E|nr:NADH dehydrogenase (ubiquinone) complex I, assembly factor 6 homolog [Toxorhynchites rutilus septentrionalis]XP_055622040.1 NADH dehydrogenase (ubiquinone) complex I, assembly factor 6 homolog [Toxorhynchites rutilus septentrionalis]XP_055622046.1 NADH dehydrogenase (ubiquinone) complex I, assembly factor 6 homolog [Toxorhynchites rutilus septentrionalis]XP_055622050.1 NADH dehydrogenase (ubiquinone) complex I, assembly factor 6 homolog [Toxorhynchites rutilus septentrionalis]